MAIKSDALKTWVWVVIFSIAFAWVESAVVVYLREIYFDGGFSFPLVINWENGKRVIDPLVRIEFGREIATIIILITVGWLAGSTKFQKFSFFMIAFGIWDIFYYIWLYVLTSWPESLMTWDLLFYVPLPWVGPVLTPVLIAITMVAAGSLIIYYDVKGYGLLLIVAFCWDWKNILQIPGNMERTGIPNPFAWWLYLPVYLFSVVYFVVKLRKTIIENR